MESEAAERGEKGASPSGRRRFDLDRSKVKILLCDKDANSSDEVLQLLYRCSYQVIPVRTARQVIEVLNTQGPDIDIILAEVDLPIAKGLKMLKYIMRDKELRRIPIIMMSAQDEVSVVAKCLRLGAADYLLKPLRTNELLNLWTHMWRRRRMLGLAEKDVLGHDFDLALSDPSDANTNSPNLLSDDTEDKSSRAKIPGTSVMDRYEYESNAYAVEPVDKNPLENESNIKENVDCKGLLSCPKKNDLRIAERSAFFCYVKRSAQTGNSQFQQIDGNATPSAPLNDEGNIRVSNSTGENGLVANENVHHMNIFPMPAEFPVVCLSSETQPQSRYEVPADVAGVPPIFHLPIYVPPMLERNMVPSSVQDVQVHTTVSTPPQYNVLPQCSPVPMIPPFSYQPIGIHLQSGQPPPSYLWPSMASTSVPEVKSSSTQRRAAALIKFRQKRKDRCFDKKIRYVNRKRLAEKRQRVRGQFVRQTDGLDAHRNTFPSMTRSDLEKHEEEEPVRRASEVGSPGNNASD